MEEKQIRIIHIDTEKTWRGGQQQVAYLHQSLYKKGYFSLLVCQPQSALYTYCKENKLPCKAIKMFGELDFISGILIANLCSKYHIKILHLHSAHALAIGLWTKLFYRKIKLISVRRVDFHLRKNWFSKFKYNNHLLDIIVCISEGIKRILIKDKLPEKKLIVIHSGIDIHKFDNLSNSRDLKKELNIPKNSIIVGTIAAMVGHKDYPNLLNAARIVLNKTNNVYFIALGTGPDKKIIFNIAEKLDLRNRFIFVGFQENVGAFLKIFDVFVMSSKLEGLGTSILDALAVGLPVVACRTGGIPEAIKNKYNGILVPPQHPNLLAEAILNLINNKKLRTDLSRNALESVKKFDINSTVNRYIELYKKLLEEKG